MKFLTNGLVVAGMVGLLGPSALPAEPGKPMTDPQFLVKALSASAAEIKLGESAEKKAEHKEVRAFARKMVEQHTKQRTALLKLAGSMKLAVVESIEKDDRAELARLSRLSGAAHDKEYMTFVVNSHEKALKLYQDWAKQAISSKQREVAEKVIPIIKEHLKLAREVLGKLKSS